MVSAANDTTIFSVSTCKFASLTFIYTSWWVTVLSSNSRGNQVCLSVYIACAQGAGAVRTGTTTANLTYGGCQTYIQEAFMSLEIINVAFPIFLFYDDINTISDSLISTSFNGGGGCFHLLWHSQPSA